MARKIFVILWLISILVFSSSAWGENVSTLLEEGIYAEETKGDLNEAITIYKKIIDKFLNFIITSFGIDLEIFKSD